MVRVYLEVVCGENDLIDGDATRRCERDVTVLDLGHAELKPLVDHVQRVTELEHPLSGVDLHVEVLAQRLNRGEVELSPHLSGSMACAVRPLVLNAGHERDAVRLRATPVRQP